MKLKLFVLLTALGLAGNAMAVPHCDVTTPPGFQTINQKVLQSSGPLRLPALQAPSTTVPFATLESSMSSVPYIQLDCFEMQNVSRQRPVTAPLRMLGPTNPVLYATKIPNIAVSFAVAGSGIARDMPETLYVYPNKPNNQGLINISISPSRFIARFYKTGPVSLAPTKLQDAALVLNAMPIGHSTVHETRIYDYEIGDIWMISTPECTVDKPITIDYGTVNQDQIRNGLSKKLDFGMTCYSDYGAYKAVASVTSPDKSISGDFILVNDAANNKYSMTIELQDQANRRIKVDGSTKIDSPNTASGARAAFSWNAILKQDPNMPAPARGAFKASAIITLDII